MRKDDYEVGYWGKPSVVPGGPGRATTVHLKRIGADWAACGYTPAPRYVFQFCSRDMKNHYIECPKCKEFALRALKAMKEDKPRRPATLVRRAADAAMAAAGISQKRGDAWRIRDGLIAAIAPIINRARGR